MWHYRSPLAVLTGLLVTGWPSVSVQAAEVFASIGLHSSSEPVPVYDMVHGWGDDVRRGRYAWADGRVQSGFLAQGWMVAWERRWHYDFRFGAETAEFYGRLEQGDNRPGDYRLQLQATALQMRGVRAGYEFEWQRFRVQPVVSLYRVDQYQAGRLQGFADSAALESASVLLDYHFDDDKLLGWPTAPEDGHGVSADLNLAYNGPQWQFELQLQDLWNRFELPAAAFTRGCINLGFSANPVCLEDNAAAGNSGYADYHTHLQYSGQLRAVYTDLGVQLTAFWHDRYQRISAQKNWRTRIGELGLSAHSTAQLGLHWSSNWHQLALVTDQADWQQARHLQVQLALRYPW